MSKPPKKQSKAEKKTFLLVELFDEAARDWGWTQDRGVGKSVDASEAEYNSSKQALIEHINRLHKQLKDTKASLKHARRESFL